MKKIKRFTAVISVVLCMCILCCSSVFAAEKNQKMTNGYHASLSKVGIDFNTYQNMPKYKQNLYKNLIIGDVITSTKYYKYTEIKEKQINSIVSLNTQNQTMMEEISKEQFLLETYDNINKKKINSLSESQDEVSTSWLTMTTKLAPALGDPSNYGYILTSDVTSVQGAPLTECTHVIGLGTNTNYSVIKDSAYLKRTYDTYQPIGDVFTHDLTATYYNANKKQSNGYAFITKIKSTEIENRYFMALRIKPNVDNATICDGFGHFARSGKSIEPSLSFSSDGASLSISPGESFKTGSTHVQLNV